MAGITLEQAQAQLDAYLAAETAVLSGQAYEIAGRKMTRADLGAIQQGITTWNDRVKSIAAAASSSCGRVRTLSPGW